MKTIGLNGDGMSCGNCVRHVTEALEGLSGVHAVRVELEAGTAQLNVDDGFDPQLALGALDDAGYDAAAA